MTNNKKGWGYDSSNRMSAQQVQGLEFKPELRGNISKSQLSESKTQTI
jgi:hypothetical protein